MDRLVAAVEAALRSSTPPLSGADIRRCRFTPVVLQPGYHMGDVDDYLDVAEHRLAQGRHGT